MTSGPRVRRSLRRLAIAALVVLLPIAAHALWDYVELQRLIREIEAIRDAGEPVRVDYDDAEPFQGARSAGSYYLASAVLLPRPHAPYGTLRDIASWLQGAQWPPHPRQALGVLQAVVRDASESLALSDKGAQFEYRGLPYDTDYSLRSADISSVLVVNSARTIALAVEGEGDRAVDSAISGMRMRRVLRDVAPILVREDHQTAAILSLASPSMVALERLDAALEERDDDGNQTVSGLLTERARAIETLWRRYYGLDPRATHTYTLPYRSVTERILRPWISRQVVIGLRNFSDAIADARLPWPERARTAADRWQRLGDVPYRRWPWSAVRAVTNFRFLPSGRSTELGQPYLLIADRASRVAVAVERFHRDHASVLPGALDELVPEYLATVPEDPWSGGPLRYRRDDGSYTIYSVGADGRDDGGELVREAARGSAVPTERGRDTGVRVWIRK